MAQMKSLVLAAGLLAVAATQGARAADLDEGPPPDRYGSAYDDPRYVDMYRRPERPPYAIAPPPPYAGPVPPGRVYREEEDDVVTYGARRFSYNQTGPNCLPREVIQERLTRHGWHDFRDVALRGNLAVVNARRPSGRLFELSIERCSGEIVSAYPLEGRSFGPYAYRSWPWWQRPY
jgi:hypothetical protein